MWKLRRVLKWIAEHVVVRSRNLNDDKEARPKTAIEIGIRGRF